MSNYMRTDKFNPFRVYFFYVDCKEKLADDVFIENELTVYFHGDYYNKESKYMWVSCSVKRRDVSKFEECMERLHDKVLILGYTDYDEFCEGVCDGILQEFGGKRKE